MEKEITQEELEKYLMIEKIKTGQDYLELTIDDLIIKNTEDNSVGSWDIYDDFYDQVSEIKEGNIVVMFEDKKLLGVNTAKKEKFYIDFGTKSTVVGRIIEDRGLELLELQKLGEIDKKKNIYDDRMFENPTLLYFINFQKFIKDYGNFNSDISEERRPITEFKDLKFSYGASEELDNDTIKGTVTSTFYLSNLKKWTTNFGVEGGLYIVDKQKNLEKVKSFDEIESEDINPITIYFYLIGSVLHNTKNKIISPSYYISYPASTKNEIRKKISKSILNGLYKNYPKKYLLKKPNIISLTNEPLAYSVAALEFTNAYNNKPLFFSVFDFGGGTSDYSYALFTENDGVKGIQSIFNYGDKKLGGENLILELVYELILDDNNPDILLEEDIKINKIYSRNNYLLDNITENSDIALGNEIKLKDLMRPIWEKYFEIYDILQNEEDDGEIISNDYEYIEAIKNKEIEVNLLKKNEEGRTIEFPVKLLFNFENFTKILENEITKGVKNFINGLKISKSIYEDKDKLLKIIKSSKADKYGKFDEQFEGVIDIKFEDLEKVIFLGGHSSKSKLFKRILKEELQKEGFGEFKVYDPLNIYEDIKNLTGKKTPLPEDIKNHKEELLRKYKKEFIDIICEEKFDITKFPNAKTGVVFGLSKLDRDKKGFKLFSRSPINEEIPFLYNIIGFKNESYLNFSTEYSEEITLKENDVIKVSNWIKYDDILDKNEVVYTLRYTDVQYIGDKPKNISNTLLNIKNIDLSIDIDPDSEEEFYIYIRAIDADTIEYKIDKELPENNIEIDEDNIVRLGGKF